VKILPKPPHPVKTNHGPFQFLARSLSGEALSGRREQAQQVKTDRAGFQELLVIRKIIRGEQGPIPTAMPEDRLSTLESAFLPNRRRDHPVPMGVGADTFPQEIQIFRAAQNPLTN